MNFRLNIREGQFGRANYQRGCPKNNKHGWIVMIKEMKSRNWYQRDWQGPDHVEPYGLLY